MTWTPLWNIANKQTCKFSIVPFMTGLSLAFAYTYYTEDKLKNIQISEEEEMKRWSNTLSDPSHKNYNPFTFNQK